MNQSRLLRKPDYGRLIFPVNTRYYGGDTLGEIRLTWYSGIDPDIHDIGIVASLDPVAIDQA